MSMSVTVNSFRAFVLALAFALLATPALAQTDGTGARDYATTIVHRAIEAPAHNTIPVEVLMLPHPVHVEARHPREGCDDTAVCGELFYKDDVFNLRTSAGTTWQSQLMGSVSTPTVNTQCNYMALTNTAITPAMADTTLSGEISSNGLGRAQGTYTDSSGVIAVPGVPTLSVQGTTGAVTLWYALLACGQGICTSVGTGANVSTANATLSATAYVHITWTPVSGATSYYLLRNTSNSFSGALTAVAGRDSTSQPDCSTGTCAMDDIANTLGGTAVTVPASNLTNYGHYTLVHTWTASGAQSAQAFGIFSAISTGTLCFEGTFTPAAMNLNDTFQLTETVNF